jgi:hypothetical protein
MRTLTVIIVLSLGAGCVTVYQPLATLHRPIVIDTGVANFDGMSILVNCVPTDFMDRTAADQLCQRVQTLFENQGATVQTISRVGEAAREQEEEAAEEGPVGPSDLTVELRARRIHEEKHPFLWVISFMTLTMLPAMTEYTFAQDITIRDQAGFLLVTETIQARFVRYFGGGIWAANQLLDWFVREEADKLMGKAAARDFSRDYYGQLSQMVFNARMRWRVLREAERGPEPRASGKGG